MSPSIEKPATGFITAEQQKQYHEEGYFILESVIPPNLLDGLRTACDRRIKEINDEMDRNNVTVQGITHKGLRYFFGGKQEQECCDFLFSDLMASICRATLADDAYMFVEQFVVKGPEKGMKFGWHQDSGYVGYPHPPYLTCWCTLDDVTIENGTVFILPYNRAGTREMVAHVKEEGTNDMVGYFGDDPGIPMIVPAGSIACFSSVAFHRSGINTTPAMRRIYLAQYSTTPLLSKDGTRPLNSSVPFVKDGRKIHQPTDEWKNVLSA